MAKSQMSRQQLIAVETIKRVYQALIDTVNETPQMRPPARCMLR